MGIVDAFGKSLVFAWPLWSRLILLRNGARATQRTIQNHKFNERH